MKVGSTSLLKYWVSALPSCQFHKINLSTDYHTGCWFKGAIQCKHLSWIRALDMFPRLNFQSPLQTISSAVRQEQSVHLRQSAPQGGEEKRSKKLRRRPQRDVQVWTPTTFGFLIQPPQASGLAIGLSSCYVVSGCFWCIAMTSQRSFQLWLYWVNPSYIHTSSFPVAQNFLPALLSIMTFPKYNHLHLGIFTSSLI